MRNVILQTQLLFVSTKLFEKKKIDKILLMSTTKFRDNAACHFCHSMTHKIKQFAQVTKTVFNKYEALVILAFSAQLQNQGL